MSKKILILLTSLFVIFVGVFYLHFLTEGKSSSKKAIETTETATINKKETTTKETEQSQKSDEVSDLPGNLSDWNLILVNRANKIEEEPVDLKELPNGYKIDSKIYDPYMELSDAAKEAGFELTVISGYRSVQDQTDVVETDVEMYVGQGYSEDEAKEKAMKYLTVPGESEHHTGLALDVITVEWYDEGHSLEENFGETDGGKWLADHVKDYGFIIRYQKGREEITGINYEPWHIRYVGKENAEYMVEHNLTLEEYIEQLKKVGK